MKKEYCNKLIADSETNSSFPVCICTHYVINECNWFPPGTKTGLATGFFSGAKTSLASRSRFVVLLTAVSCDIVSRLTPILSSRLSCFIRQSWICFPI
jgi:hypothetical protein